MRLSQVAEFAAKVALPPSGTVIYNASLGANTYPFYSCFDGTYQWVTLEGSSQIVKVNPSNGAILNTYTYSGLTSPLQICFDGTNIWIGNSSALQIWVINTSGTLVATPATSGTPEGVIFDGTNIWTANYSSGDVTKIVASTRSVVGSYSTTGGTTHPQNLCFDGTYIWSSNYQAQTLTKFLASTGAVVGYFPVGSNPYGICFDGTYIWVNIFTGVQQINQATGAVINTYTTGITTPEGIVADGVYVWVTNNAQRSVTKFLASTGAVVWTNTVVTGSGFGPWGLMKLGPYLYVCGENANGDFIKMVA